MVPWPVRSRSKRKQSKWRHSTWEHFLRTSRPSMRSCRRRNNVRLRKIIEQLENRYLLSATLRGFNTSPLAGNDDGSAGPINLGFSVNFFGVTYSQVYVNNNGNITFGSSSSQYTPTALTNSGQTPRIAAFFADIDTRATSPVTYGTGTVDG